MRSISRRTEPPASAGRFGRRRRLERPPRLRERPRLRLREALPLLLLGGLRLRNLVREDRLLPLPGGQPLELILVDRLALDEDRRDPVQLLHVLLEHTCRAVVRLLDDAADLLVDLARNLVRIVGLVTHLTAEERHVLVAAEHTRAELLAHAVAH